MLKEKINQKLKSEKGTSIILFGLLLFLVASVVSVVILESARNHRETSGIRSKSRTKLSHLLQCGEAFER